MMIGRKQDKKSRKKRMISLLLSGAFLLQCACAQQEAPVVVEQIELVNPVGVALNFEPAAKRTIYDEKVYPAMVCAYTEECEMESDVRFWGFSINPGNPVKKGELLLKGDTDSIDKEIEDQKKRIQNMEKEYQEYLEDKAEEYKEIKENYDKYAKILSNLEAEKPEEFIDKPKPDKKPEENGEQDSGQQQKQSAGDAQQFVEAGQGLLPGEKDSGDKKPEQVENPEYVKWRQQYKMYDGMFRSADLARMRWEQDKEQRAQLYELDHAYEELILKRKNEERLKCGLVSKMDGTVTSVKYLQDGNWISEGTFPMAVADLNRKEIRCEYINKGKINKAKDVYALINGKRYEVEYQNMEPDEYKRLKELNDKVYSTFHLLGDTEDVEFGGFAVIVLVNNVAKDVLTVPKDAVSRDESTSYVYLVEGQESVYTPVKTGVSDGGYIEIVNGLQEGDKVLTQKAVVEGTKTVKLGKGEVHYDFSAAGVTYYPSAIWVRNPVKYGTCYYGTRMVSNHQPVKKGDVLATVRVVPDNIELQRQETRLQRERQRLADMRAKDTEGKNTRQITAKEEYIAELEKQLAEVKASYAVKEIVAPVDGIVTELMDYKEEELVSYNYNLFQIASQDSSYIFVMDENCVMSYGNQVTIRFEDEKKQEQRVTGMVVSSNPMSVSKALTTNNKIPLGWDTYICGSLVALSPEDMGRLVGSSNEDGWWNRTFYTVDAQLRKMDQVVLVPRTAVKELSGTPYVRIKLSNGETKYQSFVPGGSDSSYYWVVDGLEEGMELCIE